MENDLLNEESAYRRVESKVEMESIISTLLHPGCKLRDLGLDLHLVDHLDRAEVGEMIATAIESDNCSLHSLNISGYGQGIRSLAKALQSPNCHLKNLKILGRPGDCDLDGAEVARMLATAIESEKCSLHSLNMSGYGQGVRSLANALQSPNCHLKSLNLDGPDLDAAEVARILATALQSPNFRLESLGLRYNEIGSEGTKSLAEALLSPNCHLKTLNLKGCDIGSEGTKNLAEALQSPNCHLETLDLQYNKIESDGVKSLVKALESENCHLMSLDLCNNNVGVSGVEALAEFLESKSCRFEFLDLGDQTPRRLRLNNATSQAELLLRQSNLRFTMPSPEYYENYYEKYEGCWRTLLNALASTNCHVQALDIRGHSLGDDDLNVLLQALTTGSCQLKSLMLGPIGDLKTIAKALQSPHCQLKHFAVVYSAGSSKGGDPILLSDALESDHCKLHTFSFIDLHYEPGSGGSTYDHFLARIADALKQQHCKLENLELAIKHTEDDEKQLLHALKFNYICPLQQLHIDCTSPQIQKQFTDILNRNRILRQSGLANQPQVQPTTAKLFICGFSGVGKTTLRKNLLRNMVLPKILQQHPSTTGMDLQTLQFGEKKLVLCDLAGQKEFHAFHHHFVRGSDKDIFLIVCKAPSSKDNSSVVQFNIELGYWLRFIVSHSWLSSKPKVLIVLNYFSPFEDKTTDARELTRNQIDKYNGLLDFGKSYIEDNIFGVVALKPKDLRLLKANIEVNLGDLLQQRPKIPLLCCQLLERIGERNLPSFIKYGPKKDKNYHL